MGVRDLLAKHDDERFISFTDLLDVVAEAEGVPTKEVARAFSVCHLLHKVEVQLRKYDNNEISEGGFALAFHDLQEAISNTHINASADVLSEARHSEAGFLRQEVAVTLQECGITVPPCLLKGRGTPLWKHVYAVRQWVGLQAAASILTGKEPGAADSDDHQDFYHWREALKDAANSQLIATRDGESPLLNSIELSQADIRNWCDRNGFVWPIPMPAPLSDAPSTTWISLSDNLTEVSRERDTLQAELEKVTRERDEARAEEARQYEAYQIATQVRDLFAEERDHERARTAKLSAEVARLQTELTRLQATPTPLTKDRSAIQGETFATLTKAVNDYPAWAAARTRTDPVLLKEVLSWLQGRTDDRTAYVAHRVVAEHFALKRSC